MKVSKNEKGLENSNFLKYKLYTILLVLVLLVGCATQQPTRPTTPGVPLQQPVAPKEETPVETTPAEVEEPTEEVTEIPDDIKEILEKGKTKLKSYSYNYKSPESDESSGIHIKGNNIKIILSQRNVDTQGEFYNIIYIDTEAKTAEGHCLGYSSCGKNLGKTKDLEYEDVMIETPLDWLEKVTTASLIDERQVEGRDVLYLETNIGKITLGSYYGFLYKIEDGKKIWEFADAAFNAVKDSDVTPS